MNTRTRIKFCGITRAADARLAVALGVDAIGLVFTRHSRRFVEPAQAFEIRRGLPPFVGIVALFMDDMQAWVEEVVDQLRPDLLQFHGAESNAFAARFQRPWIKAVPMASTADAAAYAAQYPDAAGFLLDSHAGGTAGGTGTAFDWTRVPAGLDRPVVLAGGLDPANVARAIEVVRPYAVDVSSGIESALGIKDAAKMRAFVSAVRMAAPALAD